MGFDDRRVLVEDVLWRGVGVLEDRVDLLE